MGWELRKRKSPSVPPLTSAAEEGGECPSALLLQENWAVPGPREGQRAHGPTYCKDPRLAGVQGQA